jgi:peroxiredoxin Q/BCP
MSAIAVGQPAPDFELPATGDKTIRLSDLAGRNVVLYFYPKDSTPGCTKEGIAFTEVYPELERLDAVVLGVSRDGLKSHENFKAKQGFAFDLLSDKEEEACRAYDVIRPKKMYGKEVIGVERSTFLIDKQGVLRGEWRKVKVDGHAQDVLEALQKLAE